MRLLRSFGLALLALVAYYVRFFALRQEPITLLQTTVVVCAAGLLLLGSPRPAEPSDAWFAGWRPLRWPAWGVLAGALGLAVGLFITVDRDSHSVSDTLGAIAPSYALLLALLLRLRYERSASSASAPRLGTSS